jgi:hypothetical protein
MITKPAYCLMIIYFLAAILFIQCNPNKSNIEEKCVENHEKANQCIFNYQIKFKYFGDTSPLDSAMFYIDEVFGSCNLDNILAIRKLLIFALKEEYSNGAAFIQSIDSSIFEPPYYKRVMEERFVAMDAFSKSDTLASMQHLKNIISIIQTYIDENSLEIDSIIQTPEVLQSKYSLVFPQLYFYKANVKSLEQVMKEIDSLENAMHGNAEYFENIRSYAKSESFMIFNGY